MCYDTEKTQAPDDGRIPYSVMREREMKRRAADECAGQMETAPRPMSDAEILAELFKYHAPTPETLPRFEAINQAAKNFAEVVVSNCRSSADRSAAIRLIREARMTANAAISLKGLSL